MAKIINIKGRQVFDSRGFPTVASDVILDDGSAGSAMVPSGASTGSYEAHELRDNNEKYSNKSVFKAVENINSKIIKSLKNQSSYDQKKIDEILIDLDGSENKSNLGANAILAVSIANCKASAKSQKKEIFQYLSKKNNYLLPFPLMNVINGGAHANNSLRIQEFMIRPDKAKTFFEAMQICFMVIQKLKLELSKKNFSLAVGDEGGFAPDIVKNEDAIALINKSIKRAGFKPGLDVSICLDVAANELCKWRGNQKQGYAISNHKYLSSKKTTNYYLNLIKKYAVKSIEDPFFEDDWNSWSHFTDLIGHKVQIVGDDLFVTNKKRLKKGIKEKSANAILIKLNQIGTVSETLDAIELAQENQLNTIISHRSGDTEDTFISDLAVATCSNQIKTGSLARSERVAKYNRLLRIEEELGNKAKMNKL